MPLYEGLSVLPQQRAQRLERHAVEIEQWNEHARPVMGAPADAWMRAAQQPPVVRRAEQDQIREPRSDIVRSGGSVGSQCAAGSGSI